MKKILIAALLVCAVFCFAGDLDTFTLALSNVGTNSLSTNSLSSVSGKLEGIIVDFSGATSPDIDVDITTTAGGGTRISQTLFSIDDITADGYYPVRIPAVTTAGVNTGTTNVYTQIPLIVDEVNLICGDANKTNINVTVVMVLTK